MQILLVSSTSTINPVDGTINATKRVCNEFVLGDFV